MWAEGAGLAKQRKLEAKAIERASGMDCGLESDLAKIADSDDDLGLLPWRGRRGGHGRLLGKFASPLDQAKGVSVHGVWEFAVSSFVGERTGLRTLRTGRPNRPQAQLLKKKF